MKPNCFQCIHRSKVISFEQDKSSHSCCNHPVTKSDLEDPYKNVLATLAYVGRVEPIVSESAKGLNIQINEQGFGKGHANWPWDYEPIYIENCDGFESVKTPSAEHHRYES